MGLIEANPHGVVVDFVDTFDQLLQPRRLEKSVVGAAHPVKGMIRLPLTLDHEDHIVGIERASGLEVRVAVPLHTLLKVENVFQTISRNVPMLRQARHQPCAAPQMANQSVVNGAHGIVRRARCADTGRKEIGTTLRAMRQCG